MKTTFVTLSAAALLLAACGDKGAGNAADTTSETPAVTETASVPVIGDMEFTPETLDSYCTFFRKGHVFDYNDLSTWKFAYVDAFDDAQGRAYVMLDGERRTLVPVFENSEGGVRVVHYETTDEPKVKVLLEISEGEAGFEHVNYEGILGIIKSVDENDMPTLYDESVVMIYGDCGV